MRWIFGALLGLLAGPAAAEDIGGTYTVQGTGLNGAAYGGEAELTRHRIVDGEYRQIDLVVVDLAAVLRGDASADLLLEPYDFLNVKEMPQWHRAETVELVGEVRFPGTYPIKRDESLRSVLQRAGGLTDYAFPEGAIFLRKDLLQKEQERIEQLRVRLQSDLAVLALYIRRDFPQYLPMFGTEAVTLGEAKLESNNGLLLHFEGTTGMKTGYVCASGLNIVATIERGGRSMLAVVLGGSSARERNELTAELFLRGLSGAVSGSGMSILQVPNLATEPVNMRPLICGKESKKYVAEREAEFPLGRKGEPSYLTDMIEGATYEATDLGVLRDVPLPRPRPSYAPMATASVR